MRCPTLERGRTCHSDGVFCAVSYSNSQPIRTSMADSLLRPRERITTGACQLCELGHEGRGDVDREESATPTGPRRGDVRSADPRQWITHQHVDDPRATEDRDEHDDARRLTSDLADLYRVASLRVTP